VRDERKSSLNHARLSKARKVTIGERVHWELEEGPGGPYGLLKAREVNSWIVGPPETKKDDDRTTIR